MFSVKDVKAREIRPDRTFAVDWVFNIENQRPEGVYQKQGGGEEKENSLESSAELIFYKCSLLFL